MRSEPEGLNFEVCQRLDVLKRTCQHLEEKNATHPQLPHIKAVIEAYRSGMLNIEEGMVTYWAGGIQLCEPTLSSWDQFSKSTDQQKLWLEQASSQRSFINSLYLGLLLSIIAGREPLIHPAVVNSASSSSVVIDTSRQSRQSSILIACLSSLYKSFPTLYRLLMLHYRRRRLKLKVCIQRL
jgi:hypothetical protein